MAMTPKGRQYGMGRIGSVTRGRDGMSWNHTPKPLESEDLELP